MANNRILVNLDRCIGCWTCSFACKSGNDLADSEWRQTVQTLGSGEGIDRPAGTWPNLSMKWMPEWGKACTLCPDRIQADCKPFCVDSCPTEGLAFGDADDENSPYSKELQRFREEGYRAFSLPTWRNTSSRVTYVTRNR